MYRTVCCCCQLTLDKLEPLRQPSSVSTSGASSPQPSLSEAGDNDEVAGADDGSSDSEEERNELKKRLTPAHAVDVSSLVEPSIWPRFDLSWPCDLSWLRYDLPDLAVTSPGLVLTSLSPDLAVNWPCFDLSWPCCDLAIDFIVYVTHVLHVSWNASHVLIFYNFFYLFTFYCTDETGWPSTHDLTWPCCDLVCHLSRQLHWYTCRIARFSWLICHNDFTSELVGCCGIHQTSWPMTYDLALTSRDTDVTSFVICLVTYMSRWFFYLFLHTTKAMCHDFSCGHWKCRPTSDIFTDEHVRCPPECPGHVILVMFVWNTLGRGVQKKKTIFFQFGLSCI